MLLVSSGNPVRILFLIACMAFVSCETYEAVPRTFDRDGFSNHPPAEGYDLNPEPNAIVGMWTNTINTDSEKLVSSMLFKSDGTGLYRSNQTKEENIPLTWKYEGNGYWMMSYFDTAAQREATIRCRIGAQSSAGGRRALYQVYFSSIPDGAPIIQYVQVK